MICKNCGAIIASGWKECEFCGTQIEAFPSAVGNATTTQSFVALLSLDEKQRLSYYMGSGQFAEAQKYVMGAFGFNGPQAYEIINQVAKNKDAVIPNFEILVRNLTPKSQSVLFFDDTSENISIARAGAQKKYLFDQGYTEDEKILMLYDNAIIKSGESGFTITNKNFYSSGSFLIDKAFVIPLKHINTTCVDGRVLFINGKKVDIALIHEDDCLKVCAIVSRIIRSNR